MNQVKIPTINMFGQARAGAATLVVLLGLVFGLGSHEAQAAKPAKTTKNAINIVPTITQLEVINGELLASGQVTAVINGKTYADSFTRQVVTLTPAANPLDPTCPILDLHLDAIHLDLAGLVIDTSDICLAIDAHQGGGLLGDLLCSVANLLNQGLTLGQVLDQLTGLQVNQLLSGLTDLLNQALAQLKKAVVIASTPGSDPICTILDLTLGPLDLNLLGLEVYLDNCSNGPVQVTITGDNTGLLGQLLCQLLGGGSPIGLTLQQLINQLLTLL